MNTPATNAVSAQRHGLASIADGAGGGWVRLDIAAHGHSAFPLQPSVLPGHVDEHTRRPVQILHFSVTADLAATERCRLPVDRTGGFGQRGPVPLHVPVCNLQRSTTQTLETETTAALLVARAGTYLRYSSAGHQTPVRPGSENHATPSGLSIFRPVPPYHLLLRLVVIACVYDVR